MDQQASVKTGCSSKSILLNVLTITSWLVLGTVSWSCFRSSVASGYGVAWEIPFFLLHGIWTLFWLWGLHNLWHHVLAMAFRPPLLPLVSAHNDQRVAILYLTCDDFDSEACASCLAQDHTLVRLFICDDSSEPAMREAVDVWVRSRGKGITVVRRGNRHGYKAGNLNHAIKEVVDEEFIVLCDADEVLPPGFCREMLRYFVSDDIGFVQASHRCRYEASTWFGRTLGPSVEMFYRHLLPWRNRFGFVSCYGHGVMIRRSVWARVEGFPEILAEDLGYASRALAYGYRGVYATAVHAAELFPQTYGAFAGKHRRTTSGTVEYFQREFPMLLRSRQATPTEIVDIVLTFSWCLIGLITAFNMIVTLLVSSLVGWGASVRMPAWVWMIYLLGPLTPVLPLACFLIAKPLAGIRFAFTAAVAFVSLVPSMAWASLRQLAWRHSGPFEVSGRMGRQAARLRDHTGTILFGAATVLLALIFRVASLPATVTAGVMIAAGPALCFANRAGLGGWAARCSAVAPYLLFAALVVFQTGRAAN